MEKQWDSSTIKSGLFLLEVRKKPKYMHCNVTFWHVVRMDKGRTVDRVTGWIPVVVRMGRPRLR